MLEGHGSVEQPTPIAVQKAQRQLFEEWAEGRGGEVPEPAARNAATGSDSLDRDADRCGQRCQSAQLCWINGTAEPRTDSVLYRMERPSRS